MNAFHRRSCLDFGWQTDGTSLPPALARYGCCKFGDFSAIVQGTCRPWPSGGFFVIRTAYGLNLTASHLYAPWRRLCCTPARAVSPAANTWMGAGFRQQEPEPAQSTGPSHGAISLAT